jgi:hypothetical protein
MTYESRNNLLLPVREERRTMSARDLPIIWCRVARKVSDSNADLIVVFHSSTNRVLQNAGRTFSNRNREAASTAVCCQLHHSCCSYRLLQSFRTATDKSYTEWIWQSVTVPRKTDCAIQNCRGLDIACSCGMITDFVRLLNLLSCTNYVTYNLICQSRTLVPRSHTYNPPKSNLHLPLHHLTFPFNGLGKESIKFKNLWPFSAAAFINQMWP